MHSVEPRSLKQKQQ